MTRMDDDRLPSGMSRLSVGPPYPTSQNPERDLMPSLLVSSNIPRQPHGDSTSLRFPVEHSLPNRFHHSGRAATNGLLDSSLGLRAGSSSWGSNDGYPPVSHIPPPGPSTAAAAESKPPSCKFNMSLVHEGADGATRTIGLKLQVPPPVSTQGFDESVKWTGNLLGKLTQDVANRWDRFQTCSADWREDLVEGFPEGDVYKLLNVSNARVSVGHQTGVPESIPYHGTEVTIRRSDGSQFHFHPSAGDVVEVVPEPQQSNTTRAHMRSHEGLHAASFPRKPSSARSFVRTRPSTLASAAESGLSDIGPLTAESFLAPPLREDGQPTEQARKIMELVDQGVFDSPGYITIDDIEYALHKSQLLKSHYGYSRQRRLHGESGARTTMPSRLRGLGRGLSVNDTFDLPLIDE